MIIFAKMETSKNVIPIAQLNKTSHVCTLCLYQKAKLMSQKRFDYFPVVVWIWDFFFFFFFRFCFHFFAFQFVQPIHKTLMQPLNLVKRKE